MGRFSNRTEAPTTRQFFISRELIQSLGQLASYSTLLQRNHSRSLPARLLSGHETWLGQETGQGESG
jgi:hypothetical protein